MFNGNAFDYIGQAHVTSLINGLFVSDRFGNPQSALYLNKGYATVPPGVYFNSSFTITAWVYPLDQNSRFQRIIEFSNGPWINIVGLVYSFDSFFSFAFLGDSRLNSQLTLYSTRPTIALAWSHYALVYDGQNVIIYLNGSQSASQSYSIDPENVMRNNCYIGRSIWDQADGNYDAQAVLDDLKIYNRPLSSKEVLGDMNLN
jgi:hypothetical protein